MWNWTTQKQCNSCNYKYDIHHTSALITLHLPHNSSQLHIDLHSVLLQQCNHWHLEGHCTQTLCNGHQCAGQVWKQHCLTLCGDVLILLVEHQHSILLSLVPALQFGEDSFELIGTIHHCETNVHFVAFFKRGQQWWKADDLFHIKKNVTTTCAVCVNQKVATRADTGWSICVAVYVRVWATLVQGNCYGVCNVWINHLLSWNAGIAHCHHCDNAVCYFFWWIAGVEDWCESLHDVVLVENCWGDY